MNNVKEAQDELLFIKDIIKSSREKLYDNGAHLIHWGILVSIGQFSNYITIKTGTSHYLGYIWLIIVALGWGGGIFIGRREKLILNPDNFATKIANALWLGGGISMTIIGLGAAVHFGKPTIINSMAINPVISTILGGLYFTTGKLYEMKWLSRLAFGWWAVAITLFYWISYTNFLLFGIVTTLLMVVPGIILNRNYNRVFKSRSLEEE